MQITQTHIERGRQMRSVVQHDVVHRGLSVEQSMQSLSDFLGVSVEVVKLGIGLVNGHEDGTLGSRFQIVR